MNAHKGRVTGIPGVADGQVTATVADAWFDADTTAKIIALTQRVERVHGKAAKRLSAACGALDEALQGHALETRLRDRLLSPLLRDCDLLAEIADRVQIRLSVFAPARSQAVFDQGMALQLQDIEERSEEDRREAVEASAPPQFGYVLSEDSFNRLERARDAAMLLASVGEGNGERMAISYGALAASAAYIFDDLAAVVANARHTSELDADHGPH